MLSSLHISHYILIDSLDISFPEGLVIITGQTGAGKSILLGALSLVTGARADASFISAGADSCVVEAEFDGCPEDIRPLLEENDVEWDGGHLTVRRVIHSSGRSRSFINDCPVQVSLLQEISGQLIDIHSQHKSLLLTDKRFQMGVLDMYAGNSELLSRCRTAWGRLQQLRSELDALKSKLEKVSAEKEYNEAMFRQLEAAALKPGELEELGTEQKSLANAELIKEALSTALSVIEPQEYMSVSASLKEAGRQLDKVAAFVVPASSLSERLESVRIELDDIDAEIAALEARVDVSPEHLEMVEDRMSTLYSLLTRHSCRTIDELIAIRDSLGEELFDADSLKERISDQEALIKDCYDEYKALCTSLAKSRRAAAPSFASSICDSLKFLELDSAVFDIALDHAPEGVSGADAVTYLFSSTGSDPVDVSRCASGGELSRIMLCLKAMMAKYMGMPTLIFDEIDTGVSGSVADKMGRMICEMGQDMQVFSITHLPQVAAKGNAHYTVTKSIGPDGRTSSSIRMISGEDRVNEIARLLSGATISDAAVANARALLDND